MRALPSGPRGRVGSARMCLVLAAVLLGACGFHPRGSLSLPDHLSPIDVRGGSTPLQEALKVFLDDAGVAVSEERPRANAVLAIQGEVFDERVLTVDPETGKSREFEVTYSVAFEVRGGDGRPIVGEQRVNLLRDYVFDETAVIGKSREREVLRAEMRRDAARQIVRRLQVALPSEG